MNRTVLVVDDKDAQRAWLCEVVRECLPGWIVHEAESAEQAESHITSELGVVVVDLCLSDKVPSPREGLALLAAIREVTKERCFNILVSLRSRELAEIRRDDPRVDAFVSLRYADGDPLAALESALMKAKERADFPESNVSDRTVHA